jgi:hypothetical protein
MTSPYFLCVALLFAGVPRQAAPPAAVAPAAVAPATVAPATVGHVALHPSQTSFYVELPDVAGAVRAYRTAPLLTLLSERRLLDPLQGLIGEDTLGELAPEPVLALLAAGTSPLMEQVEAWTEGLRVASFSLRPRAADPAGGLPVDARAVLEFETQDLAAAWAERWGSSGELGTQLPAELLDGLPFPLPELSFSVSGSRVLIDSAALPDDGSHSPATHPEGHPAGALARLPAGSGTPILRLWQTSSPWEVLLPAQARAGLTGALAELVLGPGGPGATALNLGPEGFERVHLALDRRPAWRGSGALTRASFAGLPPETAFAVAARLAPVSMKDELIAWSALLPSADLAEPLARFLGTPAGGAALTRLLAQLGPEAVLYAPPITGVQARLVAQVDLVDPAAAAAALEDLLTTFAASDPERWTARVRPYRRQPYITLETTPPEGLQALFLGPEWVFGISGRRLLIGLPTAAAATAVKAEMRRLDGSPQGRHPLAGENTWLQPGTSLLAHVDWPGTLGGLLDSARTLAGLAAGQTGGELPFDPAQLPPGALFADHLGPTRVAVRQEGPDVWIETRSSFGPESLAGLLALGGLFLGTSETGWKGAPGSGPSDPFADLGDDESGRSVAALLRVRDALNLHAAFHGGAYPPNLETLAAPSDRFPEGLFDGQDAPRDGWGRALRYERSPDQRSYRLWSLGPDGIDDSGAGDDVQL